MIKSKDLYLIIVVAIIAAVASFILANLLFKVEKVKTSVEVVEPISSEFLRPDSAYFNKDSINPTQVITIGDSENPNPFNNP